MKSNLVSKFVVGTALVGLVAAADAASVMTLGTARSNGNTVVVPVYLQVGADSALAGSAQGVSFGVNYSPSSAVTGVSLRRAGVIAGIEPLFEATPRKDGTISFLASFDENGSRIPFGSTRGEFGDLIAEVELTLAEGVTPGTRIELTLDPATSSISNQAGTVSESGSNGTLRLQNNVIEAGRTQTPVRNRQE